MDASEIIFFSTLSLQSGSKKNLTNNDNSDEFYVFFS